MAQAHGRKVWKLRGRWMKPMPAAMASAPATALMPGSWLAGSMAWQYLIACPSPANAAAPSPAGSAVLRGNSYHSDLPELPSAESGTKAKQSSGRAGALLVAIVPLSRRRRNRVRRRDTQIPFSAIHPGHTYCEPSISIGSFHRIANAPHVQVLELVPGRQDQQRFGIPAPRRKSRSQRVKPRIVRYWRSPSPPDRRL